MKETACAACTNPVEGAGILVPAARHPALKGSRFVGSRGVPDLFVCRQCGTLWQTWLDQREGFHCRRAFAPPLVPVFAADTSLIRLVEWITSHDVTSSFRLIDAHARNLIRRRPQGLREGTAVLIGHIDRLNRPRSALAAERLSMLFHLLGLVVDRAIRKDLRPDGPRVKPPTRYRPDDVKAAAQKFHPHDVDGITHCVKTHDLIRRLMWESRWGQGAQSPDRAIIVIDNLSAAIRFLEKLPLEAVDDGILRGVYAKAAFNSLKKLHNLGRLPENDHAIWMPSGTWIDLQKTLDPLQRLAASYRRIFAAISLAPNDLPQRLQMESILATEPIRLGARFTQSARRTLEEINEELIRGGGNSQTLADDALHTILVLEKKAAEADARCQLATT